MTYKIIQLIVTILVATNYANCNQNLEPFLTDFFQDKNYKLNFVTCWKQDVIKRFLMENLNQNVPKQITIIKTIDAIFAHDDYLILDLNDCEYSWDYLKKVENTSIKVLAIVDESNFDVMRETMRKYSLLVNSNVIVAKGLENGFHLSQPFKFNPSMDLEWQSYGTWNINQSLIEYFKGSPISIRRRNMKALKIKIYLVLEDENTLKHLEDFRYPSIDAIVKQNYGPIMRLMEFCNISFELVKIKEYKLLIESKDQFVFAASAPYMTKDLINTINFVRVQSPSKVCFILKRPPASYIMAIFTVSFDWTVWYALVVTLILVSTAQFFILNVEAHRQKIKFQEHFTVFDLALIALEAVCQQGTSTDPRSYSGRIIAVIFFCALMFLYVSYSANLLVLLQSTIDIKNLEELREYHINYAGMNTTNLQHYHSNIGNYIYGDRINTNQFTTISEGMEKVRDGLFAYYMESQFGYDYIKETFSDYEVCGLQEIESNFEMNLGYIGLPKNSPFKEIFKVGLLRIDEVGMFKRHFNKYFLKPQCFSKGSSFDTVGIAETYQAMFIVVFGVVIALMILLLEHGIIKLSKKWKK